MGISPQKRSLLFTRGSWRFLDVSAGRMPIAPPTSPLIK